MGTWICHLRIAEKLLDHFPELDEINFAFGNLSPDSGIPNADWTEFDPPKEVTHFLQKGEGEDAVHDLLFYGRYLSNLQPEQDPKRYSFRLGYFFHLISDIVWAKRIWDATKALYQNELEKNKSEAIENIKREWYGLDQLHVREHSDSLFWRVIVPNQNPPSYLPFIKNEALHHQYDYIRRYYSQPERDWFSALPYHYLNQKTMSRIVDDSVEAILLVHKKLQKMQNLDGLQSSVNLMPESFVTPYEGPLGN